MRDSHPILRIGLAGLGHVGGSVWRQLAAQATLLRLRTGAEFRIEKVLARRPERVKELGIDPSRVSPDWRTLAADPNLDVLVEVIGGTEEAFALIATALQNGKHVVTANKALLAARGAELFALARKAGRHLLFEASVAGGIPIIRALREGLVANHIESIHGIINGTCNYILSRMEEDDLDFNEALREAKARGYAEANESLDVDGHDTAHKAAVLAALAYGFWVPPGQLFTEGLRRIDRVDLVHARRLGYRLKLLAIIRADAAGAAEVRVHPTLIPAGHVLASIQGVYNGLLVRGDVVGDTVYYGRGAGGDPTASSILSDLAHIATHLTHVPVGRSLEPLPGRLKPMDEVISRYYLRLLVLDRPGVLAAVAQVFARREIGISSVMQPEAQEGEVTPLVLMVHDACEAEFQAAVTEIAQLAAVKAPPVFLRVEDFEAMP